MNKKSKVYIVGAGPGSAGFISVRGLQVLRQADCVIYDRLIGEELLYLVPQKAELIYVGKEHTEGGLKQEQINRLIIEKAGAHKTVVRLKGGDPMIFGRATEELQCLTDNNINFEIIPGITAASAAAAYAGAVLTDRNTASAVTFVTGQAAEGREIDIDFKSLAKINGTIVFYMAVKNMSQICQKLIEAGMAADTNAVVVADASLPNQKIVKGTVSDISEKCAQKNVEPPAVMIISKTCFSWFEKLPLFGKRVLITRDKAGNADFASRLAACGAEAIEYPAFEIRDLTDTREFEQVIGEIKNYDWVFFTSATGVRLFFQAAARLSKDTRIFAGTKVACIGEQTAQSLEDFGIKTDFMPAVFTSQELAAGFIKEHKPAGQKILLLRSAVANSRLEEKLQSAGAQVRQVSVYTAEKIKNDTARLAGQLRQGSVNWIAFASSFAVDCFFADFSPQDINEKTKTASIGPSTTETLKKYGAMPAVEAREHTIGGLIEAMEKAE